MFHLRQRVNIVCLKRGNDKETNQRLALSFHLHIDAVILDKMMYILNVKGLMIALISITKLIDAVELCDIV